MVSMSPVAYDATTDEHPGDGLRPQRYRLADLVALAHDEQLRYEIIDGDLIVTPAPGRIHGIVSTRLGEIIARTLAEKSLTWTLIADPINLELESETSTIHCEPDLSIFDQPAETVAGDLALAPVIVVEIVSPGNPENDYVRKVEAYASMGIPEYWIVDPGNQAVTTLRLVETAQGRRYAGQSHSSFLPDLALDPAVLFKGLR